jgi:PAS domain S-box-containing protein
MAEQEPQDALLDVVAGLLSDQPIGQRDIWFQKVIETAHEGIGIIDAQGQMIYVNRRLCEISGYLSAELLGRKFYEFQVNDPDEGERRLAERQAGKRDSYEVRLRRKDGSLVWVLMNANPILNERGEMVASLGMAFDINDRRIAEEKLRDANTHLERRVAQRTESLRLSEELARQTAEHNQLLIKELEHRVANNLTGLLGLVGAMRGQSHDVNSFADAIEARLRGLAHVHEMLRKTRWNAVDLRELIESTLKAMRDSACFPTEESVDGPRVEVAARFVQALTLILLELYTNSCKYGAHSAPGGRLAVRWTLVPDPAGPKVQLTWQERGGPPRNGPVAPSLGTQLMRLFATNELHGRCDLTFSPEGVEHLIEFPADGGGNVES